MRPFRGMRAGDFFDAPEVLDCAVTPIPGSGSSPLEVVASLAIDARKIAVRDGIGSELIGLYVGGAGQEVLHRILGGPGDALLDVYIPQGSRVSLRSLGVDPIVAGQLTLEFLEILL